MKITMAAAASGAVALAATLATAIPAAAGNPGHGPGVRAACGIPRPGDAQCFTLYAPQVKVNTAIAARAAGKHVPTLATTPKGWGAKSIESAYKLPVRHDPHATVAVVDAYSTPHLAADIAVYRKRYGLPPCTTASGCLRTGHGNGCPAVDT
jgi:hypothetical protein